MKKKILLSLYDRTGNWSEPYLKDDNWIVFKVDIQNGIDILTWDYQSWYSEFEDMPEILILIAQPCDCFALCGNRHKAKRKLNGEFDKAMELVNKTREIIYYFELLDILLGYCLEQPMSDIHTHNKWLGKPVYKFNPCDFAQYDPIPSNSQYNKKTWLFGKFNKPVIKGLSPIYSHCPFWSNYGGRSLKTKNSRSITPLGFSYAFYEANH